MTKQKNNTAIQKLTAPFSRHSGTHATAIPLLCDLSATINLCMVGGLCLVGNSAQAGTFTDAPGALQGDVALQHQFQVSSDSIYQEDNIVGDRTLNQHTSALVMRIGLLNFMSADIRLPVGSESLSFSNVYEMKYDPLSQTGSYLDTPEIADVTRSGNGLQGTELALNFYPFHTKIYSNRGDTGNWQMGVVYRVGDKTNFYTVDDSGSRGSGIGASAFGIQTAFSNKNKHVEPYLVMKALRSNSFTADVRADDGTLHATSKTISPSNTVDIRGGTEIYLKDDVALASYVTLDLFGAYRYQSFQSIPSGIYLPSILESTQDTIITQTELVSIQGGVGTNIQINSLYAFRFSGQAGFASPQRIEHIYEVNTQGTFQWGVFGEMRFRYRTTSS